MTKAKRRGGQQLTWAGFGLRWFGALVLVLGTFNPSGTSYWHWISTWTTESLALKVLVGLLIVAGFAVYLRATSRSLGVVGVLLTVAVCATVFWLLADTVDLEADSWQPIAWATQFILSVVLALGVTGSFLWRRLTGQYTSADEEHDHDE